MAQELKDFADKELERIEQSRQEAIKLFPPAQEIGRWVQTGPTGAGNSESSDMGRISAKGGVPFLGALPVGESRIHLLARIPKDHEDPNGSNKKMFFVEVAEGGETKGWTVNPKSPLYRDLLTLLKSAPCWIRVIRTGEGKQDTRYTVKIA